MRSSGEFRRETGPQQAAIQPGRSLSPGYGLDHSHHAQQAQQPYYAGLGRFCEGKCVEQGRPGELSSTGRLNLILSTQHRPLHQIAPDKPSPCTSLIGFALGGALGAFAASSLQ